MNATEIKALHADGTIDESTRDALLADVDDTETTGEIDLLAEWTKTDKNGRKKPRYVDIIIPDSLSKAEEAYRAANQKAAALGEQLKVVLTAALTQKHAELVDAGNEVCVSTNWGKLAYTVRKKEKGTAKQGAVVLTDADLKTVKK